MKNSWQWGLVTSALLNDDCVKNLAGYNRILVGFSGGLDSTVLVDCLLRQPLLVKKLTAVHINHGLSPNASAWQNHCQALCDNWSIPLIVKRVEFERRANIEEEARKARYQAFSELLASGDCLVLGHHSDDQAETLLLQLFRGAGIDGLAAMASLKNWGQTQLHRPLLTHSRQLLENYAKDHELIWIEDESNQDRIFSRNFLRHEVLSLVRSRWPEVQSNLVRTASLCQQAQANLDDLAMLDCPSIAQNPSVLPLTSLDALSEARVNNVLRFWFKANNIKIPKATLFEHLKEEVIHAKADADPQLRWQHGCIRRYQTNLYILKSEHSEPLASFFWHSFPDAIALEHRGELSATLADKGLFCPPQSIVEIRYRQGGELFNWHGQQKQLKKLLQEWAIPPWLRDRVPLLYINNQLAAVVGYAISDLFYGAGKICTYQLNFKPLALA